MKFLRSLIHILLTVACLFIFLIGVLERSKQMAQIIEVEERRDPSTSIELNNYKQKVLNQEKEDQTWVGLENPCPFEDKGSEFEGALSRIQTVLTMKENMRIVDFAYTDKSYHEAKDYVYGKGTENVKTMMKGGEETYKNFAELMILFDTIDNDNATELEKLKDMYTLFLLRLPENRLTGGAPQIQMTFEYGGDCNDIAAAFWSILIYFHFDAYIQWGKICYDEPKKDGRQKALHAWIKVRLKDGTYVTLDPTWYQKEFVALPNRGNLLGRSLEDDWLRYK